MIRSMALAIALLACSQASAVVYVTVEEWFKASPEQQQAYVAGTLDTLLSSSTGGLAKGTVEHFVHCVLDSHLTPAQLTDDIRKRPPKSVVSMQVVVCRSLKGAVHRTRYRRPRAGGAQAVQHRAANDARQGNRKFTTLQVLRKQ